MKDWGEVGAAIKALQELLPGWDSNGAEPVDGEAARAAWLMLEVLKIAGSEIPRVDPTPSGGVQVSWDRPGAYAELEFEECEMLGNGEARIRLHLFYERSEK